MFQVQFLFALDEGLKRLLHGKIVFSLQAYEIESKMQK